MKLEGLVVAWTHGEGVAAPFTVARDEMPMRFVWSVDGAILWTAPGDGPWSAWDPETGVCLRQSYLPEDTRVAVPLPQMVDLVLGPVVRRNQRDRFIVAWSPDASRALTVAVHRDDLTLRAADGSALGEPDGCRRPAAFSPDGERIACCSFGDAPLVLLRADDATLIEKLPCPLPLYRASDLLWPTDDILVIRFDHYEARDHRFVAFSLAERRVLWEHAGRWFHGATDGKVVIARSGDDTLVALDVTSGTEVRRVEKARWMQGPLGRGEPDSIALLDRLLARPIRFVPSAHLTGVRVAPDAVVVYHGFYDDNRVTYLDAATGAPTAPPPLPWAPPSDAEKARALAMLGRPAEFIGHRLVAPDGSVVLYAVYRNVYEVPDPDAGSVTHADVSLALWERERQAWRWETTEGPPEYTLNYTAERAQFTLGADGRGILVDVPDYGRSKSVYDVGTGDVRKITAGDVPSGPPPLARRDDATLIAEETRIDLRGANEARVDLEDDRAVAATFLADDAFVVVTARGKTIRFNRAR